MPISSVQPTVTIGLPVYNGEQWVEQALDSLVSQDYQNISIVISDDCSDDNTPSICKRYSKKNGNISFAINNQNLGGQWNLVKILEQCDSEYFVWACQDAYWEPDFISTLVSKLEENKGLVLASGSIEMINLDGSTYDMRFSGRRNPERMNQYVLIASLLLPVSYGSWMKNNLFLHGVVRTSVLKKCFELLDGVAGQDRVYILFSMLQGGWGYIDKNLYHRRIGTGGGVREKKTSDLIRIKQESQFAPLVNAWQMYLYDNIKDNILLRLKLFTYFTILLYVVSMYLKKVKRFFFGTDVLKKILPSSMYVFMRNRLK